MKNLLDRLKPEHLKALNLEAKEYPISMSSVFTELIYKHSIFELTIETAMTVRDICIGLNANLDINALHDYFNEKL